MSKVSHTLSEIPKEGSVSEDYYLRMMLPKSFAIAAPFIKEEKEALEEVLDQLPNPKKYNFVAIGAGQLAHLELGMERTKGYVSIEPLTDLYIGSPLQYLASKFINIKLIKSTFENTSKSDLFDGNNIFLFLFNIISYLENPLKGINRLASPGDVLFLATWNTSENSKKLRKDYFDYLNSYEKEVIIDPEKTVGLCNLKAFPFDKLHHYKKHFLLEGNIIDVLVVYL